MLNLAQAHCPTLVAEATTLVIKFKEAFRLFALCHKLYDSNYVTDEQITELGRSSSVSKVVPSHALLLTRWSHKRFHGFLSERVPTCHSTPKDAHA